MCNASIRCVEYMSCSVNPSIKTRVSAASEPPYHEKWTLKFPPTDRVSLPHRNGAKRLLAVPVDISNQRPAFAHAHRVVVVPRRNALVPRGQNEPASCADAEPR